MPSNPNRTPPDNVLELPQRRTDVPATADAIYDFIPAEVRAIWRQVLIRFDPASYDAQAWLIPTQLVTFDEARAVVGVTNVFSRDEVRDRFTDVLEMALSAVLGRPMTVTVMIDKRMVDTEMRRALR